MSGSICIATVLRKLECDMRKKKEILLASVKDPYWTIDEHNNVVASGSGEALRFNDGKVPYEFLPLQTILSYFEDSHKVYARDPKNKWSEVLNHLSDWHMGEDVSVEHAIDIAIGGVWSVESFAGAAHVFKDVTTRAVKPYPPFNWMKTVKWLVPYASAVRHVLELIRGVEIDPETGREHSAHVLCNLLMLLYHAGNGSGEDNRPLSLV